MYEEFIKNSSKFCMLVLRSIARRLHAGETCGGLLPRECLPGKPGWAGSCSKPSLRVPMSKWLLPLTPSCLSVTWSMAEVQQCPRAAPQHHRGVCHDSMEFLTVDGRPLQDYGSVLVEGTVRSQWYCRCQRPELPEAVH